MIIILIYFTGSTLQYTTVRALSNTHTVSVGIKVGLLFSHLVGRGDSVPITSSVPV